MGLADKIIERLNSPSMQTQEFTVEGAPDIILAKHPSIYKIRGTLYCGHDRMGQGDREQLYALIDDPNASLTRAQTAWVFNRLYESAPEIDDRFMVVSRDYAWDRETASLVALDDLGEFITSNERTSKERKNGRS